MSFRVQSAFVVLLLLGACGEQAIEGERCIGPADCVSGTECIAVASAGRRCLRTCDPVAGFFCDGGVVCLAVADVGGACVLGGAALLGEACAYSAECPAAALCVEEDAGPRCRAACDPSSPSCASCVPLASGGGYCPPSVAPDAGP